MSHTSNLIVHLEALEEKEVSTPEKSRTAAKQSNLGLKSIHQEQIEQHKESMEQRVNSLREKSTRQANPYPN